MVQGNISEIVIRAGQVLVALLKY
uniref:Uncharacterized protein n=1 Tax=Rhizophora mucronata TaxID=61149 RepID=A0A2P2R5C3_RHIMU